MWRSNPVEAVRVMSEKGIESVTSQSTLAIEVAVGKLTLSTDRAR